MSTTKAAPAAESKQTVIKTPDAEIIHKGFALTLREAQSLEVKDQTSHGRAGECLKALSGAIRILEQGDGREWEGFDQPIDSAHKAHKFLVKLRTMALTPYEQAKAALNMRMTAYESEARRKAEEEQRRLEALARKAEEDRLLAEAQAAEEAGDHDAAEEIVSQPVVAAAVTVAPKIAEIQGVSSHFSYKAEVDNLLELARHVVAHPEDLNMIEPNSVAINGRARSQRDGFKLPGCRLVKETVRSARI
ncbi:MAG: hypothetical protein ACRD1Z_13805 [Vicinamibacteria bacterium]